MIEKGRDFVFTEILWVLFVVEKDVLARPVNIAFYRAGAVMLAKASQANLL